MASVTGGEVLGVVAPASGETVRLPIMLLDTAAAVVTGEAFDAAGMSVATKKEGASAFTAFPTFDTNNWDEIGYGMYEVILRQSDATELALLDTEGHLALYVKTTATRGDVFLFKVNTADVARPGDEMGLADGAIAAAKIGADAITAAKIADDALVAANFATGALTADAFAADAIVAATLATGALTADAFAADAIIAATLATDSITADAIADNAIDAGAIATDAISSDELAAAAVTEISNSVNARRNKIQSALETAY